MVCRRFRTTCAPWAAELPYSGSGPEQMNNKVEVKNISSVRHVGDAIAYELARQPAAVEAGEVLAEKQVTAAELASSQGKAMGFLIGQVMQASGGKANPKAPEKQKPWGRQGF